MLISCARTARHRARRSGQYGAICLFALGACTLEVRGGGLDPLDAFDAGVITPSDSVEAPRTNGPMPGLSTPGPIPVSPINASAAPGDASVANLSDASRPPERSGEPANHADQGCQLDGRYALRIAFNVTWLGTQFAGIVPIIEEGEGELGIDVLMELRTGANGIDALFRTCSSQLPEFVARLSREHYQAYFDDAVWDSPAMPNYAGKLRVSCTKPGCTLTGEPLYALPGARLASVTDTWPADPSMGQWPDDDGNGELGVAARLLGPEQGNYAHPPLDLFSTRRVRDLMLGLRVGLGLDGSVDSCDALAGRTSAASIDTRAVGCHADSSPADCVARELSFLNDNLPVWTVREGSFKAQRLPPDADCKTVRRLLKRD